MELMIYELPIYEPGLEEIIKDCRGKTFIF